MKKFLLCTVFAALPVVAFAAPPMDAARLKADVKTLSSDAFEGRGPATAGEVKTVDYISAQMKAAGLEPGGDLKGGKRAWTQDVPLAKSDIIGTPSISLTIGGLAKPLRQGDDVALRANMRGETHVSVKDAPVVFVGYGVKAPERNWDDFKGMDLKGKIALVLVNDPDFETGQGDFGGKAMTYYGRWTYKYEEAARQGAVGFIVIHETAPASYGWATVKNSNTNTMFDVVRQNPGDTHAPVEGWIQRDLTVDLFEQAGLDFEALKKSAQSRDFKPVVLNGVTFSTEYDVKQETIVSKNVVGKLTGRTRPDETVIYSGHWDHLGVGLADAKGDTIYNGAIDNATGIAGLLELGRAYAKAPRTARTVVFMAVTAEEKGLLGSEFYAANPLYPLAKTAGVINMDSISPMAPAKDFTISGSAEFGLLDDLIAEGAKNNRTFIRDPNQQSGGFYRSDHFPFAKRGVPALSFGSGRDMVEGGREASKAWGETYGRDRYHQPADEFEESWPFTGMAVDLSLLYDTGRALADSSRWPEWADGQEFKAARDASKSERK